MTAERDTERIVRSWLELGATRLPDHILDGVLDQLPATPQRRPWWPAWRFAQMNVSLKLAMGAAAIVLVALIGYNLLPGRSDSGVGGPEASPTASPTPTPIAPAASAIKADSARNCRRIRSLAAPRAARMATSFWRVVARARSRFATFPHATSSTSPVEANSKNSTRRAPPNRGRHK